MFKTTNFPFHPIVNNANVALPKQFTYPFYYEPHPLCIAAANEVKSYLELQTDFEHNFGLDSSKTGLKIGKMFGVMVVESVDKKLGYIAAFSGKLGESNHLKGFVPPIYDTLNPDGFYKKGEAYLNSLSEKITRLEHDIVLKKAQLNLTTTTQKAEDAIEKFKRYEKEEKQKRNQIRIKAVDLNLDKKQQLFKQLDAQSKSISLQLKLLKRESKKAIETAKVQLNELQKPIESLKLERKTLSADLQKQIHKNYQFLNAKQKTKNLLDIFKTTNLGQPPAAAGECAAPKLFQFAYNHKLKPVAMAEFWWGASPKSEIRQHQQFYPSCRGKCEPILGHMMLGLDVEPNPIAQIQPFKGDLDIIYEDEYLLLVNKPHEFLSVPGKTIKDSVLTRLQTYLPNASGPLLVHRLDMSTSGLLLAAKNEKTHKNLQKQFINRSIKKRYVALLNGKISKNEGIIDLPLRVDLNNRPRQLVCYTHGKPAKTKYKVIGVEANNTTRVHFYPISGRTHQLRVHAAHHLGLHAPIVGDDLYGNKANRLHLHSAFLSFMHPVKQKQMRFICEVPF